jgi:drug/metabolite transporter (DMT)-like permease
MKAHKQDYNNLLGIILMLINAAAISTIYVAVKDLRVMYSSNLIVFIYKSLILVSIIPWCFYRGLSQMKTSRLPLHALRGFLSAYGSLCLFYSLKYINVADATALGYIEQVLLVIVGMTYFQERVSKSKIFCIILSFIGAVTIVCPDLATFEEGRYLPKIFYNDAPRELNKYYIFVFLSIMFWGLNCTIVKVLGKTEKNKVQMFYGLIFQLLFTFPLAFLDWKEIGGFFVIPIMAPTGFLDISNINFSLFHCLLLALIAICYFAHSTTFFFALKHAELSTVIPFEYSRLVFGAVLAYVFFGEVPKEGSVVGYLLIVFAGIYLVRAEARYKRRIANQSIKQLGDEFEHA